MKTSPYNKSEHLEGYVGKGQSDQKSDVQQEYEAGNNANEVKSYGHQDMIPGNPTARDGYDNSGTQGKDSLSDDTYHAKDKNPSIKSAASRTGSSSDDFKTTTDHEIQQRDEDEVLNTGL